MCRENPKSLEEIGAGEAVVVNILPEQFEKLKSLCIFEVRFRPESVVVWESALNACASWLTIVNTKNWAMLTTKVNTQYLFRNPPPH